MIEDQISYDVAKELITVLSFCDNSIVDSIPDDVFIKLRNLAAFSKNDYFIDVTKSLSEQALSDECRSLISALCCMYMSDLENGKSI